MRQWLQLSGSSFSYFFDGMRGAVVFLMRSSCPLLMSLYIFSPSEKKRKWFLFFKFLPFHFLIASLYHHHRFVAWVVGQFAHSNFGAVFLPSVLPSTNYNCLMYLCFSQHIFQLIFSCKIRIYISYMHLVTNFNGFSYLHNFLEVNRCTYMKI